LGIFWKNSGSRSNLTLYRTTMFEILSPTLYALPAHFSVNWKGGT